MSSLKPSYWGIVKLALINLAGLKLNPLSRWPSQLVASGIVVLVGVIEEVW